MIPLIEVPRVVWLPGVGGGGMGNLCLIGTDSCSGDGCW